MHVHQSAESKGAVTLRAARLLLPALLLGLTSCRDDLDAAENPGPIERAEPQKAQAMQGIMHIALEEGFADEAVTLHVNDREAYAKEGVNTDTRIGLADSFELPLEEGLTRITLRLGAEKAPAVIELDFTRSVYLAVSIVDGRVRYRLSDQPFRYM